MNMTYPEAVESLRAQGARDVAMRDAIHAEYRDLKIRPSVDIELSTLPTGSNPVDPQKSMLRLAELQKPYIILVSQAGHPRDSVYLIGGESEFDVQNRAPSISQGPNGPRDSITVVRDRRSPQQRARDALLAGRREARRNAVDYDSREAATVRMENWMVDRCYSKEQQQERRKQSGYASAEEFQAAVVEALASMEASREAAAVAWEVSPEAVKLREEATA